MPLDDIRVLDLTIARAGPTAVRQLADWGADVVSIDPPPREGAEAAVATNRHGSDFQNLHRNTRSLTLDLKHADGHAAFMRLVADADVVVENFRPPVKHRLGVDYDTLRAVNPALVYGSISGFGQDGPYAERGGVDQIAQGLGGMMSITGRPDTGPLRAGVAIADMAAGLQLAIGILVALHDRARTGAGRWVHTSLLESMVGMLDFQAARWTIDGEVPPQAGNDHPTMIPMGTFATADGHLNIAAPGGRLWRAFCVTIGADDLLDDPRYATVAARSAERDTLNDRIAECLSTRTTADWVEMLNGAGVPSGPVNSVDQTFADPQVQHLGLRADVDHPVLGSLGLIRNATNIDGVPPTVRTPTPELGEHTDAVLAECGFTPEEIADLHATGAV